MITDYAEQLYISSGMYVYPKQHCEINVKVKCITL